MASPPIAEFGPAAPVDQDGMEVLTAEHGRNTEGNGRFGRDIQWFDVDGDGALDLVTSQGKEERPYLGSADEGVVFVVFMEWGDDGKPRARRDIHGFGGGLGFAAYRPRRLLSLASGKNESYWDGIADFTPFSLFGSAVALS